MKRLLAVVAISLIATVAAGAVETPAGDTAGPVPVPEPGARTVSYYQSGNVLWLANVVLEFALPAALLFTGFSARIRDWATTIGRKWLFILIVYWVILAAIMFLAELPLSWYQGYVRPHAYDLSNLTPERWLGNSFKELALSTTFGAMFLWVPYLLLARSPQRWWLYTGLTAVPIMIFVFLVSPIWVAPLFNDFGPMKDAELEAKIVTVAERAGVTGGRVYEVDMSVDTKQASAYVTGLLSTKRIVLFDNIIDSMTEEELLFVVGHESGHYVLGHVTRWIVMLSLLILGALYLAHRLSESLLRRWSDRFGFDSLADPASLPLILLMFNLFFLLITPAVFAYGRHMEHEADRFGLELTQNNRAAATAFVKLQQKNLAHPSPGWFYKLWRSSHPTLGDRIEFCNTYRPWKTGEPLKYDDYFKD